MRAIKFNESNKTLTHPNCQDLHVYSDGEMCVSVWQLNAAELAAIAKTGKLRLTILSGESQPPVGMDVFSVYSEAPADNISRAMAEYEKSEQARTKAGGTTQQVRMNVETLPWEDVAGYLESSGWMRVMGEWHKGDLSIEEPDDKEDQAAFFDEFGSLHEISGWDAYQLIRGADEFPDLGCSQEECEFIVSGIGIQCQAAGCRYYVHPGDKNFDEISSYYKSQGDPFWAEDDPRSKSES